MIILAFQPTATLPTQGFVVLDCPAAFTALARGFGWAFWICTTTPSTVEDRYLDKHKCEVCHKAWGVPSWIQRDPKLNLSFPNLSGGQVCNPSWSLPEMANRLLSSHGKGAGKDSITRILMDALWKKHTLSRHPSQYTFEAVSSLAGAKMANLSGAPSVVIFNQMLHSWVENSQKDSSTSEWVIWPLIPTAAGSYNK